MTEHTKPHDLTHVEFLPEPTLDQPCEVDETHSVTAQRRTCPHSADWEWIFTPCICDAHPIRQYACDMHHYRLPKEDSPYAWYCKACFTPTYVTHRRLR